MENALVQIKGNNCGWSSLLYNNKHNRKNQSKIAKNLLSEKASFDLSVDVLGHFRYVFDDLVINAGRVIKDLSKYHPFGSVVYPCDIVELRETLRSSSIIEWEQTFPVFSTRFAERYFSRYPLFILFDSNRLKQHIQFGGLIFVEQPFKKAIKRIQINAPVDQDTIRAVQNIIKSESPGLNHGVRYSVPGISPFNPRLSYHRQRLTKQAEIMPAINLTQQEQQIFNLIRSAKQAKGIQTEFRVAGGWVRDKLLGVDSDDIDISVSQPGVEIARAIEEYANEYGIKGVGRAFGVSLEKSADPKSNEGGDLMVGGIPVFGQKIEFVPMRVERYPNQNSRTPEVSLTDDVREDVSRRDLTINSMYYNIDTGEIEDYVGGLQDLKNMVLKTPAEPIKTFMDDPLRMLRVVRFMTKYDDAKVDPAIVEAMMQPEVHEAYANKVHPSRAAKELRKIFGSEKPVDGARLMFETQIYKPVFKIPEDWYDITIDQQNPHHHHNLMEHTLEVMNNFGKLTESTDIPEEERALMNMATFSHDFFKMHPKIRKPKKDQDGNIVTFQRGEDNLEHMQYIDHDTEGAEYMASIMKEMGFGQHERDFVKLIVANHMTPHHFENRMTPKDIGKFLHKTDKLYRRVLEHAHADALSKGDEDDEKVSRITNTRLRHMDEIEKYKEELGDLVYKPVIDGNRLREIASQIDPEMVQKNATISHNKYSRPVHFMTYINDKMQELQWSKKIRSVDDAEKWADQAIRQFSALWREQKQLPKLSRSKQSPERGAISGNEIMQLIPEISPKTGFIQEVINYVYSSEVSTAAEAKQKVLEWKRVNIHRYMGSAGQDTQPKQSSNWYLRSK